MNYQSDLFKINCAIHDLLLVINYEKAKDEDESEKDGSEIVRMLGLLMDSFHTYIKNPEYFDDSSYERWIIEIVHECEEMSGVAFLEKCKSNEVITKEDLIGFYKFNLNLADTR